MTCSWPGSWILVHALVLAPSAIFTDEDLERARRELRIEPLVDAIPLGIEGGWYFEQLLYVTRARRVMAEFSPEDYEQYRSLTMCGEGARCSVRSHEELFGAPPAQGRDPYAYAILDDWELHHLDEELQRSHGAFGRNVASSCTVTCEGCFHSNMVDMWTAAYRDHIGTPAHVRVLLVGEDDSQSITTPFHDRGTVVTTDRIPNCDNFDDVVSEAQAQTPGRVLDVLHVSSGCCRVLLPLLSAQWVQSPAVVSYLPTRTVPPPFLYEGPDGCSLSWLVRQLALHGYILHKHTDRVTLFRQARQEDAPDEVICFASYPQLEYKDWATRGTLPIAFIRDWIQSPLGPETLTHMRQNLSVAVGDTYLLSLPAAADNSS